MNFVDNFLRINRKLSQKVENILPQSKPDLTTLYDELILQTINLYQNPLILDLGGGRNTSFVRKKKNSKYTLWIIDSDRNELENNSRAEKLIIADLNYKLPIKSSSVDIVISRYTLEHLENPEALLKESHRILKKNGIIILLFSCKFAVFAVLNRLLPQSISKLLLEHLVPGSHEVRGFKPYYHDLCYAKIMQIFTGSDLKIQNLIFSYYQSRYYTFFFPLYLIFVFYEFILKLLDLKNMSAYILIKAVK
jgi:ubiquinone/menaquinone biosynthesis C-methylase UbiE